MNAVKLASHTIGNPSAPHRIEVFLDYVCPYSKKMFNTLYNDVFPALKTRSNVKIVFMHQIQPWHSQSTLVHQAALCVSQLDPSMFFKYSKVLFDNIESFMDVNTYTKSPVQIFNELSVLANNLNINQNEMAGLLKLREFDQTTGGGISNFIMNGGNSMTDDLKYFIKVGRHQSIHVSPTVVVDGIENGKISSSWTGNDWLEYLNTLE